MFVDDDLPLLVAIAATGLWAVAYELYTRRRGGDVARRKSSDFRQQATKEPYELELESGETVVFLDPNQMETESSFDLSREDDPERALRLMIKEGDWGKFWAEYRTRPQGETNATLEDAMEYYGANRAKRRSSAT